MTDLPDFLVIGAMKCGTSTLQAQLAKQPGVFMTTPKEPNYFSDDEVFARGLPWYQGLFAAAEAGDLKGEASTHYTKLPTYPQTVARMTEVLKAPKLIYVIRDPVVRAVSHFLHEWSVGNMDDDVDAAFAQNEEMVSYGCYAKQLAPFIAAFGREAIYLTSLEQLGRNPDDEIRAIGTFLGLSEPLVWDHHMPKQNVSAERIRRFPLHKLLIDNPVAAGLRRALVPQSLRQRVKDGRVKKDRPTVPDAVQLQMQKAFIEDRNALAALFPDHPALTICYPFAPS
jgi:hypothetical protein